MLSLSIDGLAIPPAPSDGGYGAGYVFSPTELALRGYVFTRRAQNVIVSLHRRLSATPPDIAQACIELVCQRYRERTRIGEVSRALSGARDRQLFAAGHERRREAAAVAIPRVAPVSGFARVLAATATDPAVVAAAL